MSEKEQVSDNVVKEPLKNLKNFRASSDIENFYRFIYENNLRREAGVILKNIHSKVSKPRKKGRKLQ